MVKSELGKWISQFFILIGILLLLIKLCTFVFKFPSDTLTFEQVLYVLAFAMVSGFLTGRLFEKSLHE